MTPKERVYAALDHREPDRIPWGEHSIDYNVYEAVLGRPTLVQAKFRQTRAYWEGRRDEVVAHYKRDRLELLRALEMDVLFVNRVPPQGYHPAPLEKVDEETYRNDQGDLFRISSTTHDLRIYMSNRPPMEPPTVEALEAELERARHQPPEPPDESVWELVRHAVREMGSSHFVMLLSGDIEFPSFGHTDEERLMNLALYPHQCALLTQIAGTRLLQGLDVVAQADLGIDAIMPCGDLGSSTGMLASPQWYRQHVFPWHRAYCRKAHAMGLKVLKHCCGNVNAVVELFPEAGYDAYEGIQHSGGMDLRDLKARVGHRLTLWGGIWHEHIILGTPEDIRADARYAFTHAAPGGGYIMGSSHSLAVDARPENILEMKRCRDEWGIYPIDPKRFA
ncbi:MAG: uroporphyrinogen decarboxylase family protein [Candidatus Brocadiia bacterium]